MRTRYDSPARWLSLWPVAAGLVLLVCAAWFGIACTALPWNAGPYVYTLAVSAWDEPASHGRGDRYYGSGRIRVESEKCHYQPNEPIPIRVVIDTTPFAHFTLPPEEHEHGDRSSPTFFESDVERFPPEVLRHRAVSPVGLSPDRPAFDVLVIGQDVWSFPTRADYAWAWSEHTERLPPPRIRVLPYQRQSVIDMVWYPPDPPPRYMRVWIRTAGEDLPTPIGRPVPEPPHGFPPDCHSTW